MKTWLSISEVCELRGVPATIVREWCINRVVEARKVSGAWSILATSLPRPYDPEGDDKPLDLGGEYLLI